MRLVSLVLCGVVNSEVRLDRLDLCGNTFWSLISDLCPLISVFSYLLRNTPRIIRSNSSLSEL